MNFLFRSLENLPGVSLATEKHFYFKLTSGTQPSGALPAAPSEKTNSEKVSCCTTARCLAPRRRGDKDEPTFFFFFFPIEKGTVNWNHSRCLTLIFHSDVDT